MQPQYPVFIPPPEKPFWKSGGGIALIVTGGFIVSVLLVIFCCLGMVGIGASRCSGANPPADCVTSTGTTP